MSVRKWHYVVRLLDIVDMATDPNIRFTSGRHYCNMISIRNATPKNGVFREPNVKETIMQILKNFETRRDDGWCYNMYPWLWKQRYFASPEYQCATSQLSGGQ
ncbi:hypothetical protein D8B26_002735 [Coccidioides posadasii str. Silveira]|uniref:uncharacterized protein n=1 Tax=Coccidioides posadasii (strain RMSCC 757 / Silveira) TaxID=443226 RepID=UPI001BF04194|nr:hypothetical protein D8B26_002735 [Coccidioides posadasii str. Silveira]